MKEIQKTNEIYKEVLEIKKSKTGYGVFALKELEKGCYLLSTHDDVVLPANEIGRESLKLSDKDSHTIQIDWDIHIQVPLPIKLINHSCVANLGAKSNGEGYDFWTMKDISEGDELTFDYETTEYEMESPFACDCCANDDVNESDKQCRGMIKGFKHNGDIVTNKYPNEFIASYLK